MNCTNPHPTEGIDLFPNVLTGFIAIVVHVDKETGTLHFHQGNDCVLLPHDLAGDFASKVVRAAGITYGHAEN